MLDQCLAVVQLGEARESAVGQANAHLSSCSSSDDGVGVVKEGQVLGYFASDFVLVFDALQLPLPHSSLFGLLDDIKEHQYYEQIEDRAIP